jgi:hypothetical protein
VPSRLTVRRPAIQLYGRHRLGDGSEVAATFAGEAA